MISGSIAACLAPMKREGKQGLAPLATRWSGQHFARGEADVARCMAKCLLRWLFHVGQTPEVRR